jgi:hypothetical protein
MSDMKQVIALAGLSLVLSGPMSSLAGAAEPYAGAAASDGTTPLPAVDGLNAKVSSFGGATDGQALYGGVGSVTLPLGFRYGLQIDAFVGGLDSRAQGDVSAIGTAAHLFWRDPARGLFGLYGQYVDFDAYSGVNTYVGAGEAALYLGRVTLEAVAGAERGNIDLGGLGSLDIDTQFFDVARVSYYPTDNFRLLAGQSYVLGVHSGWVGAEWGVGVGGGTMASLFANGGLSENSVGTVLGGLRLYFGQRDKTLIQRHREDDPFGPIEVDLTGPLANLGN